MKKTKEEVSDNTPDGLSKMENRENSPDPDALLMLEVANGSENALRILVEKWKTPLINFFYRSVRDLHTSEDLAQQTFINLYKARLTYKASAKFSTYIFYIARRILISRHRKESRQLADATDPLEITASTDGRKSLENSELEEIFYASLEEMPENQRTAILLLKQQELSYEEIADAMEANVQSVKIWIHRARKILKESLEKSETFQKKQR